MAVVPRRADTGCHTPFAQRRLDEAFGLAVGLRSIRPGEAVLVLQPWQARLKRLERNAEPLSVRMRRTKPIAVPLNATALAVLRRQIGKHPDKVFTYAGKPLGRAKTKAWRNALKRVGIDNFRWHDLRHARPSWHRQSGTPTHELQRLGGWRSSVMVEAMRISRPTISRAPRAGSIRCSAVTIWLRQKAQGASANTNPLRYW